MILRLEGQGPPAEDGAPTNDWSCSGCSARSSAGGIAKCPETGEPYCRKCRKAWAKHQVPLHDVEAMVRAVAFRRRRRVAAAAALYGEASGG